MTIIKKIKACSICGANLNHKKITYHQEIAGKIYLVEDVPALVCSVCGEIYLAPDTVDTIQKLIEDGKVTQIKKVPVYHYSSS